MKNNLLVITFKEKFCGVCVGQRSRSKVSLEYHHLRYHQTPCFLRQTISLPETCLVLWFSWLAQHWAQWIRTCGFGRAHCSLYFHSEAIIYSWSKWPQHCISLLGMTRFKLGQNLFWNADSSIRYYKEKLLWLIKLR